MTKARRLYRSILDKMLQLIESGEFPVGGRLPPERDLAEQFSVSRPTIREAIIALEVLNRVRVKTGSGVYVLEGSGGHNGIGSTGSAFELTEARAMIEGEAAALAATMITDKQLGELETALTEMADESEDGVLTSELADKKFHRIISQATNNKVLSSLVDNLWYTRDNSPSIHQAYQSICETDGAKRVSEHQEIFDAIKSRDGLAARAAMHAHFSRILDKLIAVNEEERLQEVRRQASQSRERFSLGHLRSNQ